MSLCSPLSSLRRIRRFAVFCYRILSLLTLWPLRLRLPYSRIREIDYEHVPIGEILSNAVPCDLCRRLF
jgi:hypothetical protein